MSEQDKPAPKRGQKPTEWAPTPKQMALLNTVQDLEVGASITEICEAAGVSRDSFYRWMKEDADFRDLWAGMWQQAGEFYMPRIVMVMARKAINEGDVAAAAFVAKVTGHDKQRIEHTGAGGGPVRMQAVPVDYSGLSNDEWEQLKRLARKARGAGGAGEPDTGSGDGGGLPPVPA